MARKPVLSTQVLGDLDLHGADGIELASERLVIVSGGIAHDVDPVLCIELLPLFTGRLSVASFSIAMCTAPWYCFCNRSHPFVVDCRSLCRCVVKL